MSFFYDDILVNELFTLAKLNNFNVNSNYYDPIDLQINDNKYKYYIKGLNNQGISICKPMIYIFDDNNIISVTLSQIYHSDKTEKILAWSIIFESALNISSEFKIIRMFQHFDSSLNKIKCNNINDQFINVIEYLKNNFHNHNIHLQLIIDFI